MQTNNTIIEVKTAIIGKAWINQQTAELIPGNIVLQEDRTFSADQSLIFGNLIIRMDRHLNTSNIMGKTEPLSLKKGTIMTLYSNNKRAGFKDADFSVSVKLPINEALIIIENNKNGVIEWRKMKKIDDITETEPTIKKLTQQLF